MNIHFNAPAQLHLGSTPAIAAELGPRTFRTAAQAVRFAIEQAAPVSLRGAQLRTRDGVFTGEQIRHLHARIAEGDTMRAA